MKNIFLLIPMLFSFVALQAQFNFPLDTVEVSLEYDTLKSVNIVIDNSQSTEDLEYRWTETDRILNPNWEVQFCDCRTCYSDYHVIPEDTTIDCDGIFKIAAGAVFTSFAMYVNPHQIEDEGFISVGFNGMNGNTSRGKVTFRARFTPTSTNDLSKSVKQFKVFPNPATSEVNFSIDLDQSVTGAQLRVVDLLGKEVRNETIPAGATLFQMNSSNLNTGVYFVQLVTERGDVLATKKLVKN